MKPRYLFGRLDKRSRMSDSVAPNYLDSPPIASPDTNTQEEPQNLPSSNTPPSLYYHQRPQSPPDNISLGQFLQDSPQNPANIAQSPSYQQSSQNQKSENIPLSLSYQQDPQNLPPDNISRSPSYQQGPENILQSPPYQQGPENILQSPSYQQGPENILQSPSYQQGPENILQSPSYQHGPENILQSPPYQQGPENILQSLSYQQCPENLQPENIPLSYQQGPQNPSPENNPLSLYYHQGTQNSTPDIIPLRQFLQQGSHNALPDNIPHSHSYHQVSPHPTPDNNLFLQLRPQNPASGNILPSPSDQLLQIWVRSDIFQPRNMVAPVRKGGRPMFVPPHQQMPQFQGTLPGVRANVSHIPPNFGCGRLHSGPPPRKKTPRIQSKPLNLCKSRTPVHSPRYRAPPQGEPVNPSRPLDLSTLLQILCPECKDLIYNYFMNQ